MPVAQVNNLSSVYRGMRAANAALASLAKLDGLTGLSNRRAFDESLEAESPQAARRAQTLALLMTGADWFKLYNDRYGYQWGDECLPAVAALLASNARRPGRRRALRGRGVLVAAAGDGPARRDARGRTIVAGLAKLAMSMRARLWASCR